MIKNLKPAIILLLATSVNLSAQLSNSPYTVFGMGQISVPGVGTNQAMGSMGFALPSDRYLNSTNPSSYSGLDSLTFLFEFGLAGKITKYQTASLSRNNFNGNLSYLALGFRITPWWAASAGTIPYSTVGYSINVIDEMEGELSEYAKNYSGTGGITKFYFANSIRPIKNLSLGVNIGYLLGTITRTESLLTTVSDIDLELEYKDKVHSFYIDYGLQYHFTIGKLKYSLGAIYGNKTQLSTTHTENVYYLGDTITMAVDNYPNEIPSKIGIGLALERENKLRFGIDYERRIWSEIKCFSNPLLRVRDSERLAFGIEYLPYKRRSDPWFKKLYYRTGANFTRSYIIIDDVPINSMAFSFGVGIPLRHELSMINLGIEYSQSGTMNEGLIQENYFLIHMNFSLRDLWFMKHKYD